MEELERYRIRVEFVGRATPESFKLIRDMARVLMTTATTEWEMDSSLNRATMRVQFLDRGYDMQGEIEGESA